MPQFHNNIFKFIFISIIFLFAFLNSLHSQLVRDFRVNDDTTNTRQYRAIIGAANNGNFIILWTDERGTTQGNGRDYFQRYDAIGKPIGYNVKIQTNATPKSHAFTVRSDGSFIYAWTDTSLCRMIIFDSTGNTLGNIIIVNDINPNIRFLSNNDISVCSDKSGNIIVAMSYRKISYDTVNLYIQRFDKFGNKIDFNTKITEAPGSYPYPGAPCFATRYDKSFIISWQGTKNIGYDIFMQMFDSSGQKIGINQKVNDDTMMYNFQYNPSISSDSIGNFIIVWEDARILGGSAPYSIWAQAYNPDGSLNGVNFLVDFDNIGINDNRAKVSKRRDGKYVVGWRFWPNIENLKKPQCQRYNASNQKIGNIINIAKTAPDTGKYFDDILLIGDKIISVWEDTRTGSAETRDIYCNILSYANPDSTVGISKISEQVPDDFKLYQNYPNPFNSISKIKYVLKKSEVRIQESEVRITVFDILGRKISDLVDEKQSPGIYEVSFDGENLSTGLYFYTLLVDGIKIDTKKLVILK